MSTDLNPDARAALADLDELESAGRAAFGAARGTAEVESARIEFLGLKSGKFKAARDRLKELPPAVKPLYGQRFNAVKSALEQALEEAADRVRQAPARAGS